MPPLRLSCTQLAVTIADAPKSTLTPLSSASVISVCKMRLAPGRSSGCPAPISTLTVSPQVGPSTVDSSILSRRALGPVSATVSNCGHGHGGDLQYVAQSDVLHAFLLPSNTMPRNASSPP